MTVEEDSPLQLSAEASLALASFYAEQKAMEEEREDLIRREDATKESNAHVMNVLFQEDWQLSQFWYDDETSKTLAEAALSAVESVCKSRRSRIVCMSSPSAFVQLRTMIQQQELPVDCLLLEYDTRFELFKDQFIQYDYQMTPSFDGLTPVQRAQVEQGVDVIILDPPFLSEECLMKSARWAHLLSNEKTIWIVCTGAVMTQHVKEYCQGARVTSFRPKHHKQLSNDFRCFVSHPIPILPFESINEQ